MSVPIRPEIFHKFESGVEFTVFFKHSDTGCRYVDLHLPSLRHTARRDLKFQPHPMSFS